MLSLKHSIAEYGFPPFTLHVKSSMCATTNKGPMEWMSNSTCRYQIEKIGRLVYRQALFEGRDHFKLTCKSRLKPLSSLSVHFCLDDT